MASAAARPSTSSEGGGGASQGPRDIRLLVNSPASPAHGKSKCDFRRRWDALAWILLHHVGHDIDEFFADVGCEATWMPRCILEMTAKFRGSVAAWKRDLTADGVVEGAAERIDVAHRTHGQGGPNLFRGKIVGCANDFAGTRDPPPNRLQSQPNRYPKLWRFRRGSPGYSRLNVAMHHSLFVRIIQAQCRLHDDAGCLVNGKCSVGFDQAS